MSPAARAGRHIGITSVVLRPCRPRHTFPNPLLLFNLLTEFDESLTDSLLSHVVMHLLFYLPSKSIFQFLQQFLLAKGMKKGGATIFNPLLLLDHSPEINNTFTETDSIDVVLHLLFYFPR